jgi:hypothetical protein
MKKRLVALGNQLQDKLRMTLEDTLAEFTDQILEDWTAGKFQDDLQGIPEAMKRLENTIKDKMEFQARISAVIPTRSLTEEEMKQGLTEEDLDDTEPLFVPPPPTPPGKFMKLEAEKLRTQALQGSRGSPGGSRPGIIIICYYYGQPRPGESLAEFKEINKYC